jgi:hypothetical protein
LREKSASESLAASEKAGKLKFVIFFTSEVGLPLLSSNFNNRAAKLCYQVGLVTAASSAILEKRAKRIA